MRANIWILTMAEVGFLKRSLRRCLWRMASGAHSGNGAPRLLCRRISGLEKTPPASRLPKGGANFQGPAGVPANQDLVNVLFGQPHQKVSSSPAGAPPISLISLRARRSFDGLRPYAKPPAKLPIALRNARWSEGRFVLRSGPTKKGVDGIHGPGKAENSHPPQVPRRG